MCSQRLGVAGSPRQNKLKPETSPRQEIESIFHVKGPNNGIFDDLPMD
jgi:hypothetical protein